jgi:hypothetical protein
MGNHDANLLGRINDVWYATAVFSRQLGNLHSLALPFSPGLEIIARHSRPTLDPALGSAE